MSDRRKHAPFDLPWETLLNYARAHRRSPTRSESMLWAAIKQHDRHKPLGVKVRRQAVLCGYIVDFYIPKRKLIIEVDGDYHNTPERQDYDDRRSNWLRTSGYQIIRFNNEEIETDLYRVLTEIRQELMNIIRSAARA